MVAPADACQTLRGGTELPLSAQVHALRPWALTPGWTLQPGPGMVSRGCSLLRCVLPDRLEETASCTGRPLSELTPSHPERKAERENSFQPVSRMSRADPSGLLPPGAHGLACSSLGSPALDLARPSPDRGGEGWSWAWSQQSPLAHECSGLPGSAPPMPVLWAGLFWELCHVSQSAALPFHLLALPSYLLLSLPTCWLCEVGGFLFALGFGFHVLEEERVTRQCCRMCEAFGTVPDVSFMHVFGVCCSQSFAQAIREHLCW